ncbi:aspartate aminotransferase family protein [Phototrophicus methaneseepsis]|uniref:Putative [LysW]-aminoadipate semialdehyde transaminase n=1 Tax=Phototrophicus methaneseepsis TaxID=2710758 RepID=A0A7S8E793_9CHLR|nr:aspartate aminotransferase family protein [Phototrophicus methaneseepsis]QPC81647.1 aspartate aminotransferase family protein [Phototrophicus methaneseepsis]
MIDTHENTALQDIVALEEAHTSGVYPKRPLAIIRGQGCTVWDADGQTYLDATSGQGVALLGHSHPAVAEAISQQAQTLITCPEIFYNDQRAALYEQLSSVLPDELDRYFLCNSGAEAIEGALKVARLLTNRTGIVATMRGFHGRTLGALSLTWSKTYREPFAPWQPEVNHIVFNNIEAASDAITENTAAVVVEVVQGEGGVYPADADYLQALRQLCTERGALLIIDEIQTGFGRTGRWFAFEHAGIVPDVIAMGKGIAGGVPMGAVAWRGELGTLAKGAHGSTFGGNPLASAAAVAAMGAMRDQNLPQRSAELGAWLLEELNSRDLPGVREIRGLGLMIGIDLRIRVTPVLQALQDHGVLALPAGKTVLRLLPPLIITQDELLRIVEAIQLALQEATA